MPMSHMGHPQGYMGMFMSMMQQSALERQEAFEAERRAQQIQRDMEMELLRMRAEQELAAEKAKLRADGDRAAERARTRAEQDRAAEQRARSRAVQDANMQAMWANLFHPQ